MLTEDTATHILQMLPPWLAPAGITNLPHPYPLIVIAAALLLTFIAILIGFYMIFSSKFDGGNSFVLVGISGSGKTTLFYQLRNGELPDVLPSMDINQDDFRPIHWAQVTNDQWVSGTLFVDYPGALSKRSELEKILETARGIIFVIDSTRIDLMNDVAYRPSVHKRRVPVLIAINKIDHPKSEEDESILDELVKNIEHIRGVEDFMPDIADKAEKKYDIGKRSKPFRFEDMVNEVHVSRISALDLNSTQDVSRFCSTA